MEDGCLPKFPETGSYMIKIPDECVETHFIIATVFPVEDLNGNIEVFNKIDYLDHLRRLFIT